MTNNIFSEEEEVDKMMEQKMKEEEERKRTKEIEERMSLEETKEQVWKVIKWCLLHGRMWKGKWNILTRYSSTI